MYFFNYFLFANRYFKIGFPHTNCHFAATFALALLAQLPFVFVWAAYVGKFDDDTSTRIRSPLCICHATGAVRTVTDTSVPGV